MYAYLKQFTDSALKSYWVADPYWEGKKSHPIAMGILIADQLGEYETRDKLIDVLKKIMANKELSVCELAKKASVSTASVSKYTRGLVEPSIKSIGKIANALNLRFINLN